MLTKTAIVLSTVLAIGASAALAQAQGPNGYHADGVWIAGTYAHQATEAFASADEAKRHGRKPFTAGEQALFERFNPAVNQR